MTSAEVLLEFVPRISVGPFRFGMSRADSRAAAALLLPDSPLDTSGAIDRYRNNALQLTFAADDTLDFVEIYMGSDIGVGYLGGDLGSMTDDEVREHLAGVGRVADDDPEYPAVYTFVDLDLVLWRPADPAALIAERDEEEAEGELDDVDRDYWADEIERAHGFQSIGMSRAGHRDDSTTEAAGLLDGSAD